MNEDKKRAFMNMLDLVSDYSKYVMMEKFLEGSPLTAKSFTMDVERLPTRAVYDNLRQWKEEGILKTTEHRGAGGSYEYILDVDKLIEKLS